MLGDSLRTASLLLVLLGSAAEVHTQQCVQPPPGMTAWYTFDETSGAQSADWFLQHDGVHGGTPTPTPGMVDGALLFNDTIDVDRVLVDDHAELDFGTGDFSIDAWIRVDTLSDPGYGA